MKSQSLFYDLIAGAFRPFVGKVVEMNKEKEKSMLHKSLLTTERSLDMSWETTGISKSVTAADIVALDSPLPLKDRPAFSVAKGDIVKIGVKYRKGEKEVSKIRTLEAITPEQNKAAIKAQLLDDVPRAITGVSHRLEIMLQEALSTGSTLVEPADNAGGVGIRVTFNGGEDKETEVTNKWSETSATPISDIRAMIDKAGEGVIKTLYMSKGTFDKIRASKEGKELVKAFLGQTGTALPSVSRSNMEEALTDEFGVGIMIVNDTFTITNEEGKKKTIKPFSDKYVVGVPDGKLGRVVYGELVEEYNPVAGVTYQKAGEYTLVSKYSTNEPTFGEWTTAQALAIPVIDTADEIYRLKVLD